MEDVTPTRNAVIELKEERAAMRDGHVFLDEKCLLLAAEMLRQIEQYRRLWAEFLALQQQAAQALRAATMHHGLDGVQCYAAARLDSASLQRAQRHLMGVPLQTAELALAAPAVPGAALPSPEAAACGPAFQALLAQAARLAAAAGNLERLYQEYRRSSRRARALQDVLLPELEQTLAELEAGLDELEQEDAMRVRLRKPLPR